MFEWEVIKIALVWTILLAIPITYAAYKHNIYPAGLAGLDCESGLARWNSCEYVCIPKEESRCQK